MSNTTYSSIIRIYSTNNEVVGTAFAVAERRILTCVHVIQVALELDNKQTGIPADLIRVDFPLSKYKEFFNATVIAWDLKKDIAVLELTNHLPLDVAPTNFVQTEKTKEIRFRSFGFPKGFDAGVWATGVIKGFNADNWLQLEDVKAQGYKVEQGFSGGPIWDDDRHGIVGMVVAEDTDDQRKVAYGIPSNDLIAMLQNSGGIPLYGNPYRGLEPFEAAHAKYFFGRTRMIQSLAEKVSQRDFIAVVGPSGSGKSSLIRAGLLPRLKSESPCAEIVITPTNNPLDRLILSLLDWQNTYTLSDKLLEAKKISDLLQQDAATLQRFFMQVQQDKGQEKLLLVIDQFEELFTQVSDEGIRRVFIDTLIAISEEHFAKVVIAIRADFYGNLLADPNLGPLVNESQHNILPLSRDELKEVIEQPVIMLDGKFEPGLVEIILQETMGQPGYLPLLEFALTQLWDKQLESGVLTLQSYEVIGRVAGAMAKSADTVFEKYEQLDKANLVKQVFVRLVQPGLNAPDTRRRATKNELSAQDGGEIWNVVKDLADARLVVTNFDTSTQDETVEVSHEALIQGWSLLGEWVESDREFLTWRQSQLDPEIRKWEFAHRDSGSLLHGVSLYIAKRWLKDRIKDLSDEEKEFIFHSILYSNDDYQETFPLFMPFDRAIAFIDKYLELDDERLQMNAIKAMEWINCLEEADNEQLVFTKLRNLTLGEYSPEIRKEAVSVLSRIDKINQLAGELSKKQSEISLKNLVFAFGYARNIPLSGIKIDSLLAQKEFSKVRQKIQLESISQLISNYKTDLAIPLVLAFALSQAVVIIGQPLASVLAALMPIQNEGYINFSIFVDIFSLALTLVFFQFVFIRTKIIDDKPISPENKMLIAVFAFLLSSVLVIVGAFARAIPQWLDGSNFLSGLNNTFDGYKYNDLITALFVLSNYSAVLLTLIILSLSIRFEVGMKNLISQTFKWALLSTGASSSFIVLLYVFDVGPNPNSIFSAPFAWMISLFEFLIGGVILMLPYWFVNIFIVWACLLGFYFGLKLSFFSKILPANEKELSIKINFKRWGIYLLALFFLFSILSQYENFLAMRCMKSGNSSAVVVKMDAYYYTIGNDNDISGNSVRSERLPIGTCLIVTKAEDTAFSEYIGPILYITVNGEIGRVSGYNVYWFANKDIIPVVTSTPSPTSTPTPIWTPSATSTLQLFQTPTP